MPAKSLAKSERKKGLRTRSPSQTLSELAKGLQPPRRPAMIGTPLQESRSAFDSNGGRGLRNFDAVVPRH